MRLETSVRLKTSVVDAPALTEAPPERAHFKIFLTAALDGHWTSFSSVVLHSWPRRTSGIPDGNPGLVWAKVGGRNS